MDGAQSMGPILTDIETCSSTLPPVVKQLTTCLMRSTTLVLRSVGGQRQAQAGFAEAAANLKLQQDAFSQADDKSTEALHTRGCATRLRAECYRALRQANKTWLIPSCRSALRASR